MHYDHHNGMTLLIRSITEKIKNNHFPATIHDEFYENGKRTRGETPEGYESDLSLDDVYFLWDDIDGNYLDEPTFGPLKYKEFYSNIKIVNKLGFM